MAHFAQLDSNNKVVSVVMVDNIKNMLPNGTETESVGLAHLAESGFSGTWKQCSYNTHAGQHDLSGTPFRGNMPGKGWYYDSTNNIFHRPRPTDKDGDSCASWTMNTTTGVWSPPITEPTLTSSEMTAFKYYVWDESVYQGDNTKGWVLV